MRFLRFVPFVLLGGLMILHGFAHTPAILGSWDLATFDEVSRQPNVWLTNAGDGLLIVFGAVWLVAALSFVVAGIGVLRQAVWWPMTMALAIVFSLPMTILWRDDASAGVFLNALLLAVLVGWFTLTSVREHRMA